MILFWHFGQIPRTGISLEIFILWKERSTAYISTIKGTLLILNFLGIHLAIRCPFIPGNYPNGELPN